MSTLLFCLLHTDGGMDRSAHAEIRWVHYAPGWPPLIPPEEDVPVLRRVWGYHETTLSPEEVALMRAELERLRPRFRERDEEYGDEFENVIRLCHRAVTEDRSMLVSGP